MINQWKSKDSYGDRYKDNHLYADKEKGVIKLTPDSQVLLCRYNLEHIRT